MADEEMDFSTNEHEKERISDKNVPESDQKDKMVESDDDSDDSSDDEEVEGAEITTLREFVSDMTTWKLYV